MKIGKIDSVNYKGIKLSKPEFEDTKDLAMFLRMNCVDVLGFKRLYTVNNSRKEIMNKINSVRARKIFKYNQCGFLIFPWAKESWIIGNNSFEQELIEIIKNYDKNAKLTFLV